MIGRATVSVFAAILALAGVAAMAPARAADLGPVASEDPVVEGVPCDSPQALAFPSVWLGHFTGGVSSYPGPGQRIALDWHDQRLCFQTRRACGIHMSEMRRALHRPEGYFTCLPIR